MSIRRHRQKMGYTPGMISLAFLALLFTGLLLRYPRLQKYHVLEVNMFPHATSKDKESFRLIELEMPRRNYRTLNLTGDPRTDQAKLDTFQLQLRGMLLRKDTVNGLHVLFEDKARYESYVRAFNVCLIEKAPVYVPQKNHLWLLYFEPSRDPYPPAVCGNIALRDNQVAHSDWNGKDKATRHRLWLGATKAFAGPLLLLLVLLVGSMTQIVKRLRTLQSQQPSHHGARRWQ